MFVLGAPQRMDVNYMEIVPTDQSYGGSQFHQSADLEEPLHERWPDGHLRPRCPFSGISGEADLLHDQPQRS